jgi:GNAT superfamily N-acetyltransferase
MVGPRKSLIVSSLELGKILAKKDRIKFRVSGSCMYPTTRPGDTLHIDPRDVAQIAVGDIAIFRRGNSLLGHRTISKGTDKDQGRTYIITRPDRTGQGDDGPVYDQDVLGVVTHIERKGKLVSPRLPRYLLSRLYFASLLKLWEYREATLTKAMEWFGRIQRSKAYRRVAQLLFTAVSPSVSFSLRIPINSWQTHDLYKKVSPSEAEGLSSQDFFTLDLFASERHRPAATMSFLFRPPECPFAGWWVKDVQVRVRYRGVGLEEQLLRKAEEVLNRWGVKEIWVNSPREVLGTGTIFDDLRFREATLPLKHTGIAANGSSCALRPLRRRCPA